MRIFPSFALWLLAPTTMLLAADPPPLIQRVVFEGGWEPPSCDNGRYFRELFEKPDEWKETRSLIDVLFYADHNLKRQFTDDELRKWFGQFWWIEALQREFAEMGGPIAATAEGIPACRRPKALQLFIRLAPAFSSVLAEPSNRGLTGRSRTTRQPGTCPWLSPPWRTCATARPSWVT